VTGVQTCALPISIWLFIEHGLVGIAFVAIIFLMIFRRGAILMKSADPSLRAYGRVLQAMVFLYTAYQFYCSAWQTDSMAYAFWVLAGLLVHFSNEEEVRLKQAVVEAETVEAESMPLRISPAM
jgi:hypothetical protein